MFKYFPEQLRLLRSQTELGADWELLRSQGRIINVNNRYEFLRADQWPRKAGCWQPRDVHWIVVQLDLRYDEKMKTEKQDLQMYVCM